MCANFINTDIDFLTVCGRRHWLEFLLWSCCHVVIVVGSVKGSELNYN